MADLPKFLEVKDAIHKGLESLNKCHGKVNNTNAYFICLCKSPDICYLIYTQTPLVLDPNVKNAYALDKWETDAYIEAMSQLKDIVSHSLWSCYLYWTLH